MEIIKTLVLPPALQLALVLAGLLLLLLRWRRTGITLMGVAGLSLYLLSLVPVARALLVGLEVYPPLVAPPEPAAHGAIVVLGGGRYPDAPEYGGDTVSAAALERLRYAARLHGQTGVPILLSGGARPADPAPEAVIMDRALAAGFAASAAWLETQSRNTAENAEFSARILEAEGIRRVYLVTHAAHMPRAVWSFERAGMAVTPAPTVYGSYALSRPEVPWFLPTMEALSWGHVAMREYIGLAWYRLRY